MSIRMDEVLCQRCRARNSIANEFCLRCGTPLMLVASSAQHRYEDLSTPEPHGEHLLERISILEYRLSRVTKIAERAVDTALRQAEISDKMCDLLAKLTATIAEMQAEEQARIESSEAVAPVVTAAKASRIKPKTLSKPKPIKRGAPPS